MAESSRRKEIQSIHKKHRLFYELLGGAVLLVIGVAIAASFFGIGNRDYHMNLATEVIGVGVTVVIFDRIYAHRDRERQREQAQRDEERQTEELKRSLVRDAGIPSNDMAIKAISELQARGWLEGNEGLLKGADLSEAELKKADLSYANLMGAVFYKAELQHADLAGAILHRASFNDADMQHAELFKADLRNSRLVDAKLQYAQMYETDLSGATLSYAKLNGAFLDAAKLWNADLRYANFSKATLTFANLSGANVLNANFADAEFMDTKLPDGTTGNVSEMDRFTNPNHPDFLLTLGSVDILALASA